MTLWYAHHHPRIPPVARNLSQDYNELTSIDRQPRLWSRGTPQVERRNPGGAHGFPVTIGSILNL